jgi:hypothetical protein
MIQRSGGMSLDYSMPMYMCWQASPHYIQRRMVVIEVMIATVVAAVVVVMVVVMEAGRLEPR